MFFFPVFEIFDEALKSEIIAIAVLYCKCPCGIDSVRAPLCLSHLLDYSPPDLYC